MFMCVSILTWYKVPQTLYIFHCFDITWQTLTKSIKQFSLKSAYQPSKQLCFQVDRLKSQCAFQLHKAMPSAISTNFKHFCVHQTASEQTEDGPWSCFLRMTQWLSQKSVLPKDPAHEKQSQSVNTLYRSLAIIVQLYNESEIYPNFYFTVVHTVFLTPPLLLTFSLDNRQSLILKIVSYYSSLAGLTSELIAPVNHCPCRHMLPQSWKR